MFKNISRKLTRLPDSVQNNDVCSKYLSPLQQYSESEKRENRAGYITTGCTFNAPICGRIFDLGRSLLIEEEVEDFCHLPCCSEGICNLLDSEASTRRGTSKTNPSTPFLLLVASTASNILLTDGHSWIQHNVFAG